MLVLTELFLMEVQYLKGGLWVSGYIMYSSNTTRVATCMMFCKQGLCSVCHALKYGLTSLTIVYGSSFRCSQTEAAKQCRYILCDDCCSSSHVIPVCRQHSTGGTSNSHSRMYHPESNPRHCSEEDEKPVAVNWRWLKKLSFLLMSKISLHISEYIRKRTLS